MKPEPHPAVRAWLNHQAAETLYLDTAFYEAAGVPVIDPWET
jgi:hypothetical protein